MLEQVDGDERPYLTVEVFGKELLGLLDSGASRTIIGSKGIKFIEELGLRIDRSKNSSCTVANGNRCQCIGVVNVPMCLKGRCHLIECLVVPEVSHLLILGADFWRTLGVVPDLRHKEWVFSNEPVVLNSVAHINSESVLSHLEKGRLQAVIDRNKSWMGTNLGCTDVAQHVIVTNSPPIKQRYYRVNPIVQQQIDI